MALGNRVKTDDLSTIYDSEIYELGTTYVQPANEVTGLDLLGADGLPAFTVATAGTGVPPDNNLQQGNRVWMFVEAGEAITAGDLCKIDTTAAGTPYKIHRADAAGTFTYLLRGVAQFDIASGKYGWICIKGTVVVQAATAVAAGDSLQSTTTAGEVAAITINYGASPAVVVPSVVGVALDEEAAGSRYGAGVCQASIDVSNL